MDGGEEMNAKQPTIRQLLAELTKAGKEALFAAMIKAGGKYRGVKR